MGSGGRGGRGGQGGMGSGGVGSGGQGGVGEVGGVVSTDISRWGDVSGTGGVGGCWVGRSEILRVCLKRTVSRGDGAGKSSSQGQVGWGRVWAGSEAK